MEPLVQRVGSVCRVALLHRRRDALAVALLLVFGVFFVTRWSIPFHYPSSDGSSYTVLAKAFAEGKGCRAISHPDEPVSGHSPFLWPLLLSFVYRAFGYSHTAFHLYNTFFLLLAGIAAYLWARQEFSHLPAFLVGFCLIANSLMCELSQSAFSEPSFSFFLYVTLFLYARAARTGSTWVCVSAMIVACCCALTRTIGEAVVVAFVAALIARRDWRLVLLLLCCVAVKVGAQFLVQGTAWIRNGPFVSDFRPMRMLLGVMQANSSGGDAGGQASGILQFVSLYLLNAKRLLISHIPIRLFPFLYHLQPMCPVKLLACLSVSLVVVSGCVLRAIGRDLFVPVCLLLMVSVILTWGNPSAVYRYYAPLGPLFLYCGMHILQFSFRLLRKRGFRTRLLMAAMAAVLLADNTAYCLQRARAYLHRSAPEAVTEYMDACECIRRAVPEGAVLIAPSPAHAYMETGRKTLSFPWRSSDKSLAGSVLKSADVDLILIPGWWKAMAPWYDIDALGDSLCRVHQDSVVRVEYGTTYPTNVFFLQLRSFGQALQECLRGRRDALELAGCEAVDSTAAPDLGGVQ